MSNTEHDQRRGAERGADTPRGLRQRSTPGHLAQLVLSIACVSVLAVSSLLVARSVSRNRVPDTVSHPGRALPWAKARVDTAPKVSVDSFERSYAVDQRFADYYTAHAGNARLGTAITPAYPSSDGWIQFYQHGALLLATPTTSSATVPAATATAKSATASSTASTSATATAQPAPNGATTPTSTTPPTTPATTGAPSSSLASLAALASRGIADSATGITALPLIDALLAAGSTLSPAGSGSPLTYAMLRSDTVNARYISQPDSSTTSNTTTASANASVFVPAGTSATLAHVGHTVPAAMWAYMTRSDVSPDGWQTDIGQPLTEPINTTATIGGANHHLTIQVFWRTVLVMDHDAKDATGQPLVSRANIGSDYLHTFGAPSAAKAPAVPLWLTSDITLTAQAGGSGGTVAQLGAYSRVTYGNATWVGDTLWYNVSWSLPHRSVVGWIPAAATTATAPAAGSQSVTHEPISALSPELATYLASLGGRVGVSVYDETRNTTYGANSTSGFYMGSSTKIPIMLAYMTMVERQNRGLTASERATITTMIENSNNDAAQRLYDALGDYRGVSAYLNSIGVSGYRGNLGGFGWATFTPSAMVRVLTLLHDGKLLNASDRAFVLDVMEGIEHDQRMGVGDEAPENSSVWLKDGWVVGPDGLWAANSSGIVNVGNETYIISVYTNGGTNLANSFGILNHVCADVAAALV